MREEIATFGRSGMFTSNDEGVRQALDQGYRVLRFLEVNVIWKAPICLDAYQDDQTLSLQGGAGPLTCVILRDHEDNVPCLYAHDSEWRVHDDGVSVLGKLDQAGSPADTGEDCALLSFAYLDRSSFRNMSLLGGPRNADFGISASGRLGSGRVSLTTFDWECHRSHYDGVRMYGARNIRFRPGASFERNGSADPTKYISLDIECDGSPTADADSIDVRGLQFEHDDPRHLAFRIRGAIGARLGENRYNQCSGAYDAPRSDFYRDTVIGPGNVAGTPLAPWRPR